MIATTDDKNNYVTVYNEKTKANFLHDLMGKNVITEETAKNYSRIFGITMEKEEELGKDLNKFTLKEIETILYGFKANNRNTIESYARIISSYLNWSVGVGLTEHNVLAVLKPNDFEKYLTNEEEYMTEKDLRSVEDKCVNFQDAVILRLLFIGVGGKQMSEIRNLKKSDVDIENSRLRLVNTLSANKDGIPVKYTERYMDVDSHTLKLIEGAMIQTTYEKRNGEMEIYDNIRPYTDLIKNDYVVRASNTNTEKWNTPVDKFVIYRRIATISESFGIEFLTAKFIQRSGMIYNASQLIQDDKLSLIDLKIVADKFNVKSYHNLKGILTVENIRKTYL